MTDLIFVIKEVPESTDLKLKQAGAMLREMLDVPTAPVEILRCEKADVRLP
jgi:hypothetical protein